MATETPTTGGPDVLLSHQGRFALLHLFFMANGQLAMHIPAVKLEKMTETSGAVQRLKIS